jgi:hypothetical protein
MTLHFSNHLEEHHDLEGNCDFPTLVHEMSSQHTQICGGLLELKRLLEQKQKEMEGFGPDTKKERI